MAETCDNMQDFTRLYTELEKQARVEAEVRRLTKLFKHLPITQRKAAEGLIQEAAFMRVTLEETKAIINADGILEIFEQGTQRFLRDHPATKVYIALVNRYMSACKTLADLVVIADPKASKKGALAEFLAERP